MVNNSNNISISNFKSILKGSVIILTGSVLGKALGTINQAILGRILGPSEYGLLVLLISICQILSVLVLFGSRNGIVKFISEYYSKHSISSIRAIIKFSIIFITITTLICYNIIFFINLNFLNLSDERYFLYSMFLFPVIAFSSVIGSTARAIKDTETFAISENIVQKISRLVIFLILFVIFNHGLEAAILSFAFSLLISSFFIINRTNKIIGWLKTFKTPIGAHGSYLLRYSMPLALTGYAGLLIGYTDQFCLVYFGSTYDVGIYSAAMGVALFIGLIPSSLHFLLFPSLTEFVSNSDQMNIDKTVKKSIKVLLFFTLLFFSAFVFFGDLIIYLIYGSNFSDSFFPLLILSFGLMIGYIFSPLSFLLHSLEKTKQIGIIILITNLINLILNIPLIMFYGVVGASISFTLSFLVKFTLTYLVSSKHLSVDIIDLKMYIFAVLNITILILYIVTFLFNYDSIFLKLLFLTIYFLLIYMFLTKFSFFTNEEKSELRFF